MAANIVLGYIYDYLRKNDSYKEVVKVLKKRKSEFTIPSKDSARLEDIISAWQNNESPQDNPKQTKRKISSSGDVDLMPAVLPKSKKSKKENGINLVDSTSVDNVNQSDVPNEERPVDRKSKKKSKCSDAEPTTNRVDSETSCLPSQSAQETVNGLATTTDAADETNRPADKKSKKKKSLGITDDIAAPSTPDQPEIPSFTENKSSSKTRTPNSPFRRVRVEEVEIAEHLQDNSFEAKSGARGSWGERANDVLKHTQGKSFRHEKTKKKRGSYKGGLIDVNIHSIKFND